jgi:hypothetical protein
MLASSVINDIKESLANADSDMSDDEAGAVYIIKDDRELN